MQTFVLPREVVGAPASEMLKRVHRVRLGIGVTALGWVWGLPASFENRRFLFLLVALVFVPWSLVIMRLSDSAEHGHTVLMLSGDFGFVVAVHFLVPEARYVVLMGYILITAFHSQLIGIRGGLVAAGLAAVATAARELTALPATDAYTLGMFAMLLPSSAVLMDAAGRAHRELAVRATRLYASLEEVCSSADVSDVVSSVATTAARELGADGAVVLLRDGDDLVAHGLSDERVNRFFEPVRVGAFRDGEGELPAVRAIRLGRTFAIEDARRYEAHAGWQAAARRMGVGAVLAAPISGGDDATGCILLWYAKGRSFSATDRDLAEALARQVGVALDRARAFDSERAAARHLRELDELKSDFLSTVSHELRTPLTVILGFAAMLSEFTERITPEMHAHVTARLLTNAEELDRLISQLLDFARLENGRLRIEARPVDLRDEVTRVTERLETVLASHDLRLEIASPVVAVADRDALSRVMENLLTNATKFSPAGSTITVSVAASNGCAEIAVTDEGCGVPPGEAERIFERFYRLERGDTSSVGGTGIGLAIVKQLVEAHGGTVRVQRGTPGGSRFSFTLPTHAPAAPARQSA